MKCIYCNYEIEDVDVCPVCGNDLRAYKRIRQASCICYNRGLEKAQARDLSGAAEQLRLSLKYNKYNIDARNLLGLIYLETGDVTEALGEWVISKNFMPYNNVADEYLTRVQGDSAMLNRVENAIKKYNMSISYVEQGDIDLAVIQLKQLVTKNPNMIYARSLLALLYMKEGKNNLAKKELLAAQAIDTGNKTVNAYLNELKDSRALGKDSGRGLRGRDGGSTDAGDGESRLTYIMDYSKVSVANIIIGAILGVLISIFLIFPAIRQHSNDSAMNALISANEDARSTENNITSLREEIDTLKSALDNYEGQADVKTSYEYLINAQNAVNEGDLENASAFFARVTRQVLDQTGQQTYDAMADRINNYIASTSYAQGNAHMQAEEFVQAIEAYNSVIAINEGYDEGGVLLNMASCYESLGDRDNAIQYYSRVAELFPESGNGRRARAKFDELSRQ